MTLLSICQDVADVTSVQRPTAIVSSTNQLDRQFLGFAKETLEELCLMDWPVLSRAATINTVAAQQSYDLPDDYGHEIGDTLYLADRYQRVRGQLTPGDWAAQRSMIPDLGQYRFRIYGYPLKLYIMPTPDVVEQLTYEYKTTDGVVHADTTFGTTYTEDTDVSIVPEDLVKKGIKWRLRRGVGLDYAEEFNDYEMARTSRLAQQLQMGSMPVAVRPGYDTYPLTDGYVPDHGFG